MKFIAASILLATLATVSHADSYAPSHNCRPPSPPSGLNLQSDKASYRAGVEQYRTCIDRFLDEQRQAIARHREAANAAMEEWNRFVRYDLK